jgi:hypothetical protein
VWHLRAKFARAPALFGAVLSCCSLFDGSCLPVLQRLPLAKPFADLRIPRRFAPTRTAFDQIQEIVSKFLAAYHPIVDTFETFGCKIERQPPSRLMPHSFMTIATIRATLAEMAVCAMDNHRTLDKRLEALVTSPPFDICKFDAPEESFFGYSDADWTAAFATAPRFWNWAHGAWENRSREDWIPRRGPYGQSADPCTLLVCIAWLYAPPGEFDVADFSTRPIKQFVIDEDPVVTFLAAPGSGVGPLGRFMPGDIKKPFFAEFVDT